MVIASCDSTGTLVSLDDQQDRFKLRLAASHAGDSPAYRPTALWQASDEYLDDEDDDDQDDFFPCRSEPSPQLPLHLPTDGASPDEVCLRTVALLDARDTLLAQEPVEYCADSKQRILYVGQAEVASCVPLQADVLVSDRATTCHILALHSASDHNVPLSSMTHLDGTKYCLQDLVAEHTDHHGLECEITVHVIGGYLDGKGTSQAMTKWLFEELANLADEFTEARFTIATAVVSSLNDNGAPMARGLAMDTRTGAVWLARCTQVLGPVPCLRAARIFAPSPVPRLHCIHSAKYSGIVIESFDYRPHTEIDVLLELDDEILLRYTSTSPDVEEMDFCSSVRSTLRFVRDEPSFKVFAGRRCLLFKRLGRTNSWVAV